MSIRSIDLQVLVPRATEVGKIQQMNEHQTMLQQQQVADQWPTISDKRQHQVQHLNKSEDGKVQNAKADHEKQKRNKSQQDADDKKDANENDGINNEAYQGDCVRGRVIDIKT